MLERMLPAPHLLPEACHSKAWVWAREQLQASQKPPPPAWPMPIHCGFSPRLRVGEAGPWEYLPKAGPSEVWGGEAHGHSGPLTRSS